MGIGVYLCNCGTNIKDKIDPDKIRNSVLTLPGVEYFETVDFLCSEEGKVFLENDLRQRKAERVVIAACSPREHEGTFMKVVSAAGINPYLLQMLNVREQVAWVTEDKAQATEKTVAYIKGAVSRVGLHEPLKDKEIDVCQDILIIGAGPSGLKAAISLAESGRKVILVERTPVIGGLPVRFEEVFPNMECGPCMLEPLLGDVLHGEYSANIELLTLSEVTGIVGSYGNFTATIRQSPRYIDSTKCIGCAECVGPCPALATNDFHCGLGERKAVSFPFLGALPNVPYIDMGVCLRTKGQDCTLCKDSCPVEGAVDFGDEEMLHKRNIGAIVVAVGSSLYDCHNLPNLGYGELPDVYTSLEFERILASNGPTEGVIKTKSGSSPTSVAIVHCVGSLDPKHKEYCSGICCQDAFKFNHVIEKKLPGTKIHHFFKELVTPGKEEFSLYKEAKDNPNAVFVRYSDIREIGVSSKGGKQKVSFVKTKGKTGATRADIVVLCPAIVPIAEADSLCGTLDVSTDRFGFFEELHGRMDSTKSKIRGIFLAGTCQSPMDIQSAINQGMAAAGYIMSGLAPGRKLEIKPVNASVEAERCSGCMVCISVCPYKAISYIVEKGTAEVNDVLCQGCGTCVSACPSGAIKANHFTDEEIFAEIKGVLSL